MMMMMMAMIMVPMTMTTMIMIILRQLVRPKPHQSHCQAQADNRPALTPDEIIAIIVTIIATPDQIIVDIMVKI